MNLPTNINILGKNYTVTYVEKPSEVDIFKRESLWGQIDYWTRSIRIYKNPVAPPEEAFHTLIHETLHGIAQELHLKLNDKENHDELDIFGLAICDVLTRNNFIQLEPTKECND